MTLLQHQDVCVEAVLTLDELYDDPYLTEIGAFETFVTPDGKTLQGIALPFSFRQ